MKYKSVRNCPLAPPAPLTEEEKVRRVSEEALTWREGFTESHLLVLGLLTCAGSRHLLPTGPSWHRAGYRQTVSSGDLVFGADAAQQGLPQPSLLCHHRPSRAHPTPHISPEAGVGGASQ